MTTTETIPETEATVSTQDSLRRTNQKNKGMTAGDRGMMHEKPGQTLQATALAHEAYLRLVDTGEPQPWNSRGHFFGATAEAMRRILIERARHKQTDKAGGSWQRQELMDAELAVDSTSDDLFAADEALSRFAATHPRAAWLVQLRFFLGQTLEEAAAHLGLGTRTAYRDWAYAPAWLRCELDRDA